MPEWSIALLIVLASLIWSTIAIIASPGLSRYDEWTYIDYSYRISQGELPVQGDDLSEYARQAWSCRGMEGDIRGVAPPPCDEVSAHSPSEWPFEGENYNVFHPPLYFAYAGTIGKALDGVGVDFTDGTRIASALLTAAGAACLYLAIRQWGVGRRNSVGATLIAMSAPALAQAAGIVHNDAISMLAGAAAVWLAARVFIRDDHGWFAPFLVTALIASTRTMSVVAVLTVGILAFVGALAQPGQRWQKLKPVLGVALATVLPYVLWTQYQNSRSPDDYVPSITGLSTEPFELGDIPAVINTIVGGGAPWGLTSPAGDWYLHPNLNSGLLEGWSWVLYGAFLLLIPVAFAIAMTSEGPRRYLAVLVIIVPVAAALVVQAREILTNEAYFRAISGRYAMTAIPVYTAFLAAIANRHLKSSILLSAGGLGYLMLLLSPFV